MSLDKVTSGEGTAQGQLAGKDSSTDDAGQTAGIVSRVCGVRASDTKDIKHGALGLEDGTTTKGSDLKRGHRDGDLKSSAKAV